MGFSITLIDGIVQANNGSFKLVRGKDVDMTKVDGTLTSGTLADADIFLIDDAAGGTQDSTKTVTLGNLKTYINSGLTSGTITAGGFTTTGTWTFDEYTSGTVGITTVQDSGTTFNDNDTSLLTAGAIADYVAANAGSGAVSAVNNGADNRVATFSSTDALNGETNFTWDGDRMTIASSTSTFPLVAIENTTDNANGPQLVLKKNRGGATAAQNDDSIGSIYFKGENSTGTEDVTYSSISTKIYNATDTDESGLISINTATSNGTNSVTQNVIKGTGHSTANKVDVEIGYGSDSRTTVVGDLKCDEDFNFDGVNLTAVQTGSESFSDDDVSIMTSAAIKDYVSANSSDISITGTTTNGLLSYGSTSSIITESELTYNPATDTLGIGADNGSAYKIKRVDRTNGAGGALEIIGAKAAGGADLNGGNVIIRGGIATGEGNGGSISFYSTPKDTSLAGTANNPTERLLASISGHEGDFDLNSKITGGAFKGTNIGTTFWDAIYLTPGDFNITNVSRSDGDVYTNDDGGSVRPNSSSHDYHAFVKIPIGFDVEEVEVEGSNSGLNNDSFEVFSSTWNSDSTQSKGSAWVGDTLDLSVASSDYSSVEGGYLVIQWNPENSTSELYGAKLTIKQS